MAAAVGQRGRNGTITYHVNAVFTVTPAMTAPTALHQVDEVEFINSMTLEMTTEHKRLSLQRRLEDSDNRRKERLATIIAKQEEKLSKVCECACGDERLLKPRCVNA